MSPVDPPPGGPRDPNEPPPPPPPPGGPGGPPSSGWGSPPPGGPAGPPPPGGQQFSVGDAYTWAWAKFKENAATLVIGVLVVVGIAVVLNLISSFVIGAIFGSGTVEFDSTTGELTGGRGFFLTLLFQLLASAVAGFVVYLLQAGLIRVSLDVADGRKPAVGDVFRLERLDKLLVLALLLTVGVFVGSLLCYLPGLVFGLLASFSLYFFVDRGSEGVDAIKQSFRFVIDNIGQIILVFLASVATLVVGALLCGVGLLVAIPVVLLVYAYTFRSLTGGTVTPA